MSPQFEAFIEYITIIKALSKATIEAYKNDIALIEEFYNAPLIELDEKKLLKYLSQFENKRTLNRKLSTFNAFFDFCHHEFSHKNEAKIKFKLSKIPSNLPKYLSYEEIMRAISLIDRSSWIGLRDYAMILFLYATGLRISECLSIEHSDFEDQWLRVRHAKGDKERIVPIAEEAMREIKAYEVQSPFESRGVWVNYRGKPLSRISAYKITQKYLNVSPNVLRHSYATALSWDGARTTSRARTFRERVAAYNAGLYA